MITVEYSPYTSAYKLVIAVVESILNGFFVNNKWVIEPYNKNRSEGIPNVFIPNINYKGIFGKYYYGNFNEKTFQMNKDKLIKETQKELLKNGGHLTLPAIEINEIEEKYVSLLEPIVKRSKSIFPYLNNKNINVKIYLSQYGTRGSFHPAKIDEKNNIVEVILMPRVDSYQKDIISLYAHSISRALVEDKPYLNWREKQILGEYFTQYIFEISEKECPSALKMVTNLNPELMEKSLKYLLECGLPIGKPFTYEETQNEIYFTSEKISNIFAPYEFRFLRSIIENYNKTTSYYQLSEDMYNSKADLKFSMWGINKTAQRVKDKLENLGVPREVIQNVKGEGYKILV
jgi:hypothetical protein